MIRVSIMKQKMYFCFRARIDLLSKTEIHTGFWFKNFDGNEKYKAFCQSNTFIEM